MRCLTEWVFMLSRTMRFGIADSCVYVRMEWCVKMVRPYVLFVLYVCCVCTSFISRVCVCDMRPLHELRNRLFECVCVCFYARNSSVWSLPSYWMLAYNTTTHRMLVRLLCKQNARHAYRTCSRHSGRTGQIYSTRVCASWNRIAERGHRQNIRSNIAAGNMLNALVCGIIF